MKRYRFWHRWFRREVFVEIKNTVALSVNKGLHWLRAHCPLIFLIVVSLLFLGSLIYAWWLPPDQLDQLAVTCPQGFGPLQDRNGYLEIQLAEHHPSEPVFSGKLFFVSVDPSNAGVSKVTVTRSPKRNYGRVPIYPNDLGSQWKALRPQAAEEFALVTEASSHQQFPYDSGRFNFS